MHDNAPNLAVSQGNRLRQWRRIKDTATRWTMRIGGMGVIIAIVLIFFYLLYVVFPVFSEAEIEPRNEYSLPRIEAGQTLHLAMEEQAEVAVRFTDQGKAVFFSAESGEFLETVTVVPGAISRITTFAYDQLSTGTVAYGLANGHVMVARHRYEISYPEGKRYIRPLLEFPMGEKTIKVVPNGAAVRSLGIALGEERATIVALSDKGALHMLRLSKEDSLLGGEDGGSWDSALIPLPDIADANKLLIDPEQRLLHVSQSSGHITMVDISGEKASVIGRQQITAPEQPVFQLEFLTGGISLLAGNSDGSLHQWFPVRKNGDLVLSRIRDFKSESADITGIVTEQRRKGFATSDSSGRISIFHTTAQRLLVSEKVTNDQIVKLALSPRADALLAENRSGRIVFLGVYNEHPEISWSVLWNKVWYESYPEPGYTWQSSSASNDFEPKFSLVPLAFGTLKAAFYAMLFAVPLAIMGAIFTAYFMAPRMRAMVKPTIEIMEALPTVILGFLAGLWLAPLIEDQLPGIFLLLLLLPPGVIAFAWGWKKLPARTRHLVPEGWQAALLVPVLLILGTFAFSMSTPFESLLFGGDVRLWLSDTLGLGYDQRNALVVGIAMGVAVIPTIFSIAEDAIFSVPKHLSFGSLALGATTWQTLVRVVILTASPGIFSAVMIGLGRAVGETMIVLMATGNTPVMDFSVFQGMRTLSANVAVEMPESEVDSTHYRILFLAALVLFVFTFVFNTAAEIVRQRLRRKYSSL